MFLVFVLLLLGTVFGLFDPVYVDDTDLQIAYTSRGGLGHPWFGEQPSSGVPEGHEPSQDPLTPGHNKSIIVLPKVTREAVMRCAMDWCQARVPYCQCSGGPSSECCGTCPHCATTRCDCSGFVSYCWGLRVGYTTRSMSEIAHPISKNQLRKGDIMLYAAEHVAYFGGWCNKQNTSFFAIQEPGCHTQGPHYAFAQCISYPFNWMPQMFKPYRYNAIQE